MESARVRLNVHRQDNPGLVPVNNRPCFIIETAELSGNHTDPLRATVYTAEKKSMGVLSNLKVNNYLLYILAGRHAALNGADEAIVLNSAGRICEATSSNLFFISGKKILTPALSEGCVAGVMRRQLIGCLPELGFVVEEAGIPVEIPEQVEEVFLSNAIRGIRPLASIGDRKFSHHQTLEILRRLPDPAAG
jgi:branched-chain amino acid aminotransferase